MKKTFFVVILFVVLMMIIGCNTNQTQQKNKTDLNQSNFSGKSGKTTSFTGKQLEAANLALQNGIKIDDPQGDYFKFPLHHFQPDGRPDNDNPYLLNYTDLRSLSIGVDQDYLYVKFQFWGNFPKKAPYYNGDLIWSVGGKLENFMFTNSEGINDSAELGDSIWYVGNNHNPINIPSIGQLAMISPYGQDEKSETLFKTWNSTGMVYGGAGTDYLLSAFPLSLFGIKYGDTVNFSSSTETGSTAYHHVCIDFLSGKEGYLGGSTIKYKLGENKYEIIKEPTDIMGP